MTRALTPLLVIISALMAGSASAQDLLPPYVLQRLDLTEAWARPLQVPVGLQSISNKQLFVHRENPHEFVEIVVSSPEAAGAAAVNSTQASELSADTDVIARIPVDRLGVDGQPIGKDEAMRLANNQIRRLKRRGVEATVRTLTIPRVNLYTIGSDGTLECRDAETGQPLWTKHVGDRRLPYTALGVNEQFLTVINGSNLLKVEAATGEVMEEVRMSGAPRFGAVNAGDFAMVPIIGGGIEGYPLNDPTRDPFMEIVAGSPLAMPTKAPGSSRTAWGTDRGFVYVMELQGTPSVLFRLDTDGIVSGRIASASGDRFFFGSEFGQVYGLQGTRTGKVLWSQPFGEPFYDGPVVVDEQLLIRSTYGNLYALSLEDGSMMWRQSVPNIGNVIAANNGRAYVTTLSGALAVIDLEDGQRIAAFNEVRPRELLLNTMTDRIYLVSESAEVQCLHAQGDDLPTIYVTPETDVATEPTDEEPKKEAVTPFDTDPADPFGGAGPDPFGADAGADPFGGGGGADPFGGGDAGGADPFGGGGDAPMEDPFGANPFGS